MYEFHGTRKAPTFISQTFDLDYSVTQTFLWNRIAPAAGIGRLRSMATTDKNGPIVTPHKRQHTTELTPSVCGERRFAG